MEKARLLLARIYILVAMVAFGTDIVFFGEYNDQFEQHIFGIVYDDTHAILLTIWKSYHPVPVILGIIVAVLLNWRWVAKWLEQTPSGLHRWIHTKGTGARIAAVIGFFFFFVAMARGGVTKEPILLKHAFVTNDLYLNHTVVNPFTALHAVLEDKWVTEHASGMGDFWPSNDVRAALKAVLSARGRKQPAADLDTALLTHARGRPGPAPKHVFLILMESQDGWPVLPAYRHLGFAPQLSKLATEGLYYPHFLPSGDGTILSLTTLLTGMPDAGLNVNYEESSLKPYPSAIAATFKRLGYKTRFFYGGYLGWQRLDSFALGQGFDEVYGGGSMVTKGTPTNEWGVADQYLYDFMLRKLATDTTPTFNFVLTTSNHPPYDLDLEKLGFPIKQLPDSMHPTKSDTLRVLGHLWYADREVGRFLRQAEKEHPGSLFAVTGDHTTRLQIQFSGRDSVFESVAVPFLLYGPKVLANVKADTDVAGSHLDIPPTLVELCAPAGFPYYTFGRDLRQKGSHDYGYGFKFLVGEDFIATDTDPSAGYPIPGNKPAPLPEDYASARNTYHALRALSWYRVRKGSQLPP